MSYTFPIGFYVYGRGTYADLGPDRAKVLGYFSNSLIPSLDTEFPKGLLRFVVAPLTTAQQAPQLGKEFEVVNVAIDFST